MNKILKQSHRWIGFPVGIVFLITFGTGLITAIDELMSRDLYPYQLTLGFNNDYKELSVTEHALNLTLLIKLHKETQKSIRQIKMPTEKAPFYSVIKQGEIWHYAVNDLTRVSHQKINTNRFFDTMLQLHRNLLLGKKGWFGSNGAFFVAWVSLIALVISCIGLYLWWPMRKSFKAKHLLPSNSKRSSFYYTHLTAGVVSFVLILLMSLTGASITYREITSSIFGIDKSQRTKNKAEETIDIHTTWLSRLQAASRLIPEGQLSNIRIFKPRSKPRTIPKTKSGNFGQATNKVKDIATGSGSGTSTGAGNGNRNEIDNTIISLRFSTPADWLGLANSHVNIQRSTSTITSVKRFKNLTLGEKIMSLLKPLHTGRGLHIGYVLVLTILSALGALMVFSGLASFVLKRRRWVSFNLHFVKRFL